MSLNDSVGTLAAFLTGEGSLSSNSPQNTIDEYLTPVGASQAGRMYSSPSSQSLVRTAMKHGSVHADDGQAQMLSNTHFAATTTSLQEPGRSTDFSFLQQRPSSMCAPRANVTPRSSRSSSMSEVRSPKRASSVSLKSKTDLRNSAGKSKLAAVGSSQTPSSKQTLSASSRGKIRRQQRVFSPGPQTPKSSSSASKHSTLLHAKKLPLRLPRPPLALITNPHADLPEHLRRHGLRQEADDFSRAPGITVDYVMHMWVHSISRRGPASLLDATSTFMDTFGSYIRDQLARAQDTDQGLPRTFCIPTSTATLSEAANALNMLPTHVLAVHGNDIHDKGILVPCHSLMYILQCVSLPSFSTSSMAQDADEHNGESFDGSTLQVLPLRVPRPKEFALLHRFIYNHDTVALLSDLLPMRNIARYCNNKQSSSSVDAMSDIDLLLPAMLPDDANIKLEPGAYEALFANDPPMQAVGKTLSNNATEALSYLPLQSLFSLAYRIHSAWANGVAIGFLEPTYWTTLDRAWTFVVAALAIKKGRLLDSEARGLNLRRT